MADLKGKTLFITGGSRGIGLAVALRAARDGANIAIAAKTAEPNPKLPGTIYTAAKAIEAAGGNALPIQCDIRFEDQVQAAVAQTVEAFGGIDICVNNASAISLTSVADTEMKRFDLMHQINARGTFLVSKTCLPYLLKADNPHILVMCPPLNFDSPLWIGHTAYCMSKMGMSICAISMAAEFKSEGIAVNGIWPMGPVATAAIKNIVGGLDLMKISKKPQMIAEASYIILTKSSREMTGKIVIDADVLRSAGITDFTQYQIDPKKDLDENGQYVLGSG